MKGKLLLHAVAASIFFVIEHHTIYSEARLLTPELTLRTLIESAVSHAEERVNLTVIESTSVISNSIRNFTGGETNFRRRREAYGYWYGCAGCCGCNLKDEKN